MSAVLAKDNVRLVPLCEQDEALFIRLAEMPEINTRINKPFPYRQENFNGLLQKLQTVRHFYVWVIEYDGKGCGIINTAQKDNGVFQGGYWVDPEYWGRKIASQSLELVRDFLFQKCKAVRLQALVEPDNLPSQRILEKCGYQREGLLQKFYPSLTRGLIDVYMYGCIKNGNSAQ